LSIIEQIELDDKTTDVLALPDSNATHGVEVDQEDGKKIDETF